MRAGQDGKIFYGWYIAAISFVGNFMSVGSTFYVLNAFMEPLCDIRGWTRTEVNLALMLGGVVGFIGQFIFGGLVMRTGPRILMLLGAVTSGITFIFLGQAEKLWCFYALYILLYLSSGAYGGIVANTSVSNWFVMKRGRALGFSTAGMSLSGAILPFTAMFLIMWTGLTEAFLWIGLMIIMVGPLAWLIVRNWPEDYGLAPDGASPEDDHPVPHTASDQPSGLNQSGVGPALPGSDPGVTTGNTKPFWTTSRLVRSGTFWKVSFTYALVILGLVGVMSQLKPRFADIGFEDTAAMGMMSATALMGAMGKYFWGILCDRFDPRRVVALLIAATALGLTLSLFKGSLPALILFIIIFGFAMGGVMSTLPIIVADLFGRESFPAVFRFISLFLILQTLGYVIAGWSFDHMGSYDPAYILFISLDIIAVFLILSARRPRVTEY